MPTNDVYVYDLDEAIVLSDNDYILVNIGANLKRMRKSVFVNLINGLTNADMEKIDALIIDGDGEKFLANDGEYKSLSIANVADFPFYTLNDTEFSVSNDADKELSINGYHTHENQTDVLDNFSLGENDELLFNGEEIGSSYTLPTASTTTLGGVKVDGSTITITDGVISSTGGGGIDFSALSEMLLEGQNIDITADDENETLTFATIGETIQTYANNTAYVIGDIVIYDNDLYKRTVAGTDTEWTSTNWVCLSSGSAGLNAYVHIKYSATQPTQDSDMKDTADAWMGILSDNTQTASTTYTDYTWYNIKGATGSNGADGATPTIDNITKNWKIGLVDTGVCSEGQDGSVWYTGTTFPSSPKENDCFLSFAAATLGNVYQYISSDWALQGNIYGGGAEIDDTTASVSSCYSSSKVETFKTALSSDITLTVGGWSNNTQTINTTVNTSKLNTPIPSVASLEEYANKGVYLSAETSTSYTFTCKTTPITDLVIKIKSEVVAQ